MSCEGRHKGTGGGAGDAELGQPRLDPARKDNSCNVPPPAQRSRGAAVLFLGWRKKDSDTAARKAILRHASRVAEPQSTSLPAGLGTCSSLPGHTECSDSVFRRAQDGTSYEIDVKRMDSHVKVPCPSDDDVDETSAVTTRQIPLKVWLGTVSVLVGLILIAAIATIFAVSAASSAAHNEQTATSGDPPITPAPTPSRVVGGTETPALPNALQTEAPGARSSKSPSVPSFRPTARPSAPPTQAASQLFGQCNPLLIYVYDDEAQCEGRNTPSAVGLLYADAACRATQVQSSQSSAATFLLPGRYSAECVPGEGDYGQVRFLQSGCTSSTCSSSSSSSTSCDRDASSPASYYSRLDPPIYDVQALNDNFICYTLGSDSDSIVFAIFGDCSGGLVNGTMCP